MILNNVDTLQAAAAIMRKLYDLTDPMDTEALGRCVECCDALEWAVEQVRADVVERGCIVNG